MKPSPETVKLVEKSLDQSITPEEIARLEELLEDDPANLDYYLSLMEVESEIPFALNTLPEQKAQPKWILPVSIAAAASIAMYAGMQVAPSTTIDAVAQQPAAQHAGGATITSLVGVTWEEKAPAALKLTAASESFAFSSGLVELTFDSGVRTLVEGPAQLGITGSNSAELASGKLVADVPKGAEGFTIVYPKGKVVDLGTEFALNVSANSPAEVGVFRGEVEVYNNEDVKPLKVLESHAVKQTDNATVPFASVPFDQGAYIRKLPTSEFSWKLPATQGQWKHTLEFDVSHLVWKPGNYRAIFKYMLGFDALCISSVELLCDGEVITTDTHPARTGVFLKTYDNMYSLKLTENHYKKGKWTVRAKVAADTTDCADLAAFTPTSAGIMLFSQNIATEQDYIGIWEYRHDNQIHRREFLADGKARYYLDGKRTHQYESATWSVVNGILKMKVKASYEGGYITMKEDHILNEKGQLVIINQPYRNALKVAKSQ